VLTDRQVKSQRQGIADLLLAMVEPDIGLSTNESASFATDVIASESRTGVLIAARSPPSHQADDGRMLSETRPYETDTLTMAECAQLCVLIEEASKAREEGRKDRSPSSEKMTMAEFSQSVQAQSDQEPTR
jgi:hypothetical protein